MNRIKWMLLVMALLLALSGCGASPKTEETTVPETIQPVQPETTVPATEATIPETTQATEPAMEAPSFALTVKPIGIGEQSRKVQRDLAKLDCTYQVLMIDDIPVILAYPNETGPKPIHVFLHSAGGVKEHYREEVCQFAAESRGIAVALDAGAWGQSPRGRMTDIETIIGLMSDIDKVIAYCSTLEGADMSRILLRGKSLGGTSAITYLTHGSFRISAACATVPCPDFNVFPVNESAPYISHGTKTRKEKPLTVEQIQALLAQYSPMDQVERMMGTALLVQVGLQDSAYSVDACRALEKRFQELGKEHYLFEYYEAGHELPWEEYRPAAENWLKKSLDEGWTVRNPIPEVTINQE